MNLEELKRQVCCLENKTDIIRFELSKKPYNINNVNAPVWGDALYCSIQNLMFVISEQIQNKEIDQEAGNDLLWRLRRL